MPRPREFNPETVLDAALDLFWRKGYKCCSMADVVRKSGVARYGLYQAFKDKDQLYCAALKRYHQKLHDFFVKPFCGTKADYISLVAHFDRVLDQLESGEHEGCFAHQAAIERAAIDDNVNEIVTCIFDDAKQAYRHVVENALAAGQIRELPVEELVTYVMGIQRGLMAMTKQNCSLEERRDYVRCALQLLRR